MHPLVELAKKTISEYVRHGRLIEPPESPTPEMTERCGVFVSLKKHGELRGCIGTFMPTRQDAASEIIANAVSAATKDPRFSPVTADELEEITYSVDLLSSPEKVTDVSELDPRRYGVIVVSGYRKGLLLPDLEGVDTVDEQLSIARMKAGIMPGENVEIFRFMVRRYK